MESRELPRKTAQGLRRLANGIMFGKSKKGRLPRLLLSSPIAIPLIFWAAVIEGIGDKLNP